MKVEIVMGDWILTMGMVGLHRVYNYGVEQKIIPEEDKELVKTCSLGLEVDLKALEYLAEAFFRYMLSEYSIYARDRKRLQERLEFSIRKEYFRETLKGIRDVINDNKRKIEKYFSEDVVVKLNDVQERLKRIKKPEQIEELKSCVNDFWEVAKLEAVDEKLTLNYFKAVVMGPFFGQPSFLNVSKNSLDLKEQMELFYDDYVQPVLTEINFQKYLEDIQKKDDLWAYLDKNHSHKPFSGFIRKIKDKELDEIKDLALNQLPRCSFLPEYLAFNNYEEMIFSPLGVSANNALNFQWDLGKKQPTPLSSLAKLIMFFAPAGGVGYGRWDNHGGQSQYRNYTGFIQTEGSFMDVLQRNDTFKRQKDKKEPFDRIISVLVQDLKRKADYVIEHLFFIEFHSDYNSKKTLLQYYHLPMYLALYIEKYGKELESISPYTHREQFVRAILSGEDPVYIIWEQLKEQLRDQRFVGEIYKGVRERNRIFHYKKYNGKEGVKLKKQDNYIYSVYYSGREIREAFKNAMRGREEGAPYAASVEKRINGLAYRLLNTVKAGNKKEFMDSLFRLHMPIGKPVNSVFLNVLHEQELDFASVGTAFIAGLLSKSSSNYDLDKGEKIDE